MRVKDYILLALAIIGLLGYIGKGFKVEARLENAETKIETHLKKYEPMADEMHIKLAVVDQKFNEIMETLKDIKRYQRGTQ